MKELRFAELIPGTESPVGIGRGAALRCVLRVDGSLQAAVLKRASLAEVAAEAFCALLMDRWGMPVPDPFLVHEPGGVAFASGDVGLPNLKQRLGVCPRFPGTSLGAALVEAENTILSLATAPLAAAADEAVGNRDRNVGNVLWDGMPGGEVWIDHAYSFGLGEWALLDDKNDLADMARHVGRGAELQASAIARALALDPAVHKELAQGLPACLGRARRDMAEFVTDRVNSIAARLAKRLHQPEGS